VLSPLIKEEIEAGEAAGLEHYRAAGEMLLEAKSQMKHGQFRKWFDKQNFGWSVRQSQRYMALAEVNTPPGRFSSLKQAIGESGPRHDVEPPPRAVDGETAVNPDRLAQEYKNRQQKEQLIFDLCRKIVKIGFQVLSKELHPDHGGSDEAQAELNEAKLKENIERSVMMVTALSPIIGYDQASVISHYAISNDLTLKQAALANGVSEELFDRVVNPLALTHGGSADISADGAKA